MYSIVVSYGITKFNNWIERLDTNFQESIDVGVTKATDIYGYEETGLDFAFGFLPIDTINPEYLRIDYESHVEIKVYGIE